MDSRTTQDNRTTRRRRTKLVDELVARDVIGHGAVARAMRTVPRHVFVPEVDPAHAYDDEVVVTKSDVSGRAVSSCSQPAMVAIQLEQLDVRPGDRVLEIGAGTGYNAALLAELAGADGSVVTVDLDDDIVERARDSLASAGYSNVTVIHGDGELGWAADTPYDRIIATVGVGDVPPAWWNQLAGGGRVCVPLTFRGMQRSLGMVEQDGRLVSDSVVACGFIPVRGIGSFAGRTEPLTADGRAHLYRDADQPATPNLAGVLAAPAREWWLEDPLRPYEHIDTLDLMLAVSQPGYRKVVAYPDTGPAVAGESAVVDGDSFARLVRHNGKRGMLLGVRAHGPAAERLLKRLREVISVWDRRFRRKEYEPVFELTRKPIDPPPSPVVIEKPHTWLTFADV